MLIGVCGWVMPANFVSPSVSFFLFVKDLFAYIYISFLKFAIVIQTKLRCRYTRHSHSEGVVGRPVVHWGWVGTQCVLARECPSRRSQSAAAVEAPRSGGLPEPSLYFGGG